MERYPDSNGCMSRRKPSLPLVKRLSLSRLFRSTSMEKYAVVTTASGSMEPEVLHIGLDDIPPSYTPPETPDVPPSYTPPETPDVPPSYTPPETPDVDLPSSPEPKTTSSCSNLPSASPSILDANYGTDMEDRQLHNCWSTERLDRSSRSSSPLTAGRSTDGLLVSRDRVSPIQIGLSPEGVDSSGDKEDYSSGHASMSSDDMSRTTSLQMEMGYSYTDNSRSSSHRSQLGCYDSPTHRPYHAKQSLPAESFQTSIRQYAKDHLPAESYHQKSNGSYRRERPSYGSSHPDDKLYRKECQSHDSPYHRDNYWPRPGPQRTGSPKPYPKLDANGYPMDTDERQKDTMPGTLATMSMGTAVVKVKGPGRCTVKTLYLDSNKTSLRWKPSKKGNKARINIDGIKEVRDGESTDILKRLGPASSQYNPNCCFSIVYGTAWESLDLIADDQDDAAMWIAGLKYLMANSKRDQMRMKSNEHRDLWLRATFEAADKSGDGLLSIDEILKLLHKLNVSLSKRKVKQLFKEADSNTNDDNVGQLSYDEFIHFYKRISTREELDSILREYGHGKGYLTLQELARFLSLEQCMEDVTMEHCVDIIKRYEPVPENSKNGWLGIDGFARYLRSQEGNIFSPRHHRVNQDMSQPLSHYFIASSHNTYLVGDQLMSQSSVDVYAMVLQAGCRCVEMDCWDGKDGEPIIYHGYTLTSRIKFRDVITVVNKYAFVASPYPVILSIENHCSLEQQKKMAKYLVTILGDKLEVPTLASVSSHLPSPEQLKGRILIKSKKINWDYLRENMPTDEDGKKLPRDHNDDLEGGEVSEEDSADELDENFKLEKRSMSQRFESMAMAQMALMKKKPIKPSQSAWKRIAAKAREQQQEGIAQQQSAGNNGKAISLTGTLRRLKINKKKSKSHSSSESESGEWDKIAGSEDAETTGSRSESFDKDESSKADITPSKTTSVQPVNRQAGSTRSRGKRIVLSKQLSELVKLTRSVTFRGFINLPCWELPSLSEMRASNMVATKPMEFVAFTTRHMCRVYPSAYRIDSSNYNPQPMWNCGCQLVALNYQTEGKPMQLAKALFSGNGSCGYVLKPYPYRDDSKPFDPNSIDPMPGSKKTQITIHVISGQQLPKPPQSLLGERGEIIDPYVEVEIIGLPIDCAKAQTKTIQDNGFNPCWDCSMTFTVHLADQALIRFAVWDEDPIGRDFIGQATMPVRSLIAGYRHVHLEGLDQASLFVHVAIEDHDIWANHTSKMKLKGLFCRTKSVELEYSPLSGGHRNSPRRRTSLAQMFRRKHSVPIAPAKDLGQPLSSPSRLKRRSYDDANDNIKESPLPDDCMRYVYYQTNTPAYLDSLLIKLLSSGVPTELEADGSTSVHVKYLHQLFIQDISPSCLLTAIREGIVSVWSEEGGYLLTGNYNWDLVEHCRGFNHTRSEGFEEEDKWEQEEVIISPYSHSNKKDLENGMNMSQSKLMCKCTGGKHQDGSDLVLQNPDFSKDCSNERTGSCNTVHGSVPDIIKSTSLSYNAVQHCKFPSTENDWTEECAEDECLKSIESSDAPNLKAKCMFTNSDGDECLKSIESSDTPKLKAKCMFTNSDGEPPLPHFAKQLQSNGSYHQIIADPTMPPDQLAPAIPQTCKIQNYGVIYDDIQNAQTQCPNRNPLGKSDSNSSTNSAFPQYSPNGSTMSISSSLCREFDTLVRQFDGATDSDVTSLQSEQSTIYSDRNSDTFTVNDIISMTLESKRTDKNIAEDTASLLGQLDVTLSDIYQDVTSQSMDDNISDISGTEYESDTSDVDTLSTTSGETSLCNGWERSDSPNIEKMFGSFNRTNSSNDGSQDTFDLSTSNAFHRDIPYIKNGNNDVVNNKPFHGSSTKVGLTKCSCKNSGSQWQITSGSQRLYRKKHESNMKCSCSHKKRVNFQHNIVGNCLQMDKVSMCNDNNNNSDLILINNVRNKESDDHIDGGRNRNSCAPENVLLKVSQRLKSEEIDCSDNVSTTSSDSSASSASTVIEVVDNKQVSPGGKLALLQYDDIFSPDEYDTFKNDLTWRWYNSKEEPQIASQDDGKCVQTDSDQNMELESILDALSVQEKRTYSVGLGQQNHIWDDSVRVNHRDDDVTGSQQTIEQPSFQRQSSVLSNPDDDNVFLPNAEPYHEKIKPHNISPIDDMIQKLCLIVNAEMSDGPTLARQEKQSIPEPLKKTNLRKDLDHTHAKRTGWQLNADRASVRNVRFAEVDSSRVSCIKPSTRETSMQRSCLKIQKSATIDPCSHSLTGVNRYNDKFETPSIVQNFYKRNHRRHEKESLSHLSKSSPHLAMSHPVPRYAEPPPYIRNSRQQSSLKQKTNYERSQSVNNISQAGRVYEPVKRCDPAVLLYGTYRPTPSASKKKITQPPAPVLPRLPSYEQHLQKYGLPQFMHTSKHRKVEIPPSPILAQFSTERNKFSTLQPTAVRRRDKKGTKLQTSDKQRHSTGSYICMSQQQMQSNLQDFGKDWKRDESEQKRTTTSTDRDKQESPHGHRPKLKDRMTYFLLNL